MKSWHASIDTATTQFEPTNRLMTDKCALSSLELPLELQDALPLVWLTRPVVPWEELSSLVEEVVAFSPASTWIEGVIGSRTASSVLPSAAQTVFDCRARSLLSRQWRLAVPGRVFYKKRAIREITIPLVGLFALTVYCSFHGCARADVREHVVSSSV